MGRTSRWMAVAFLLVSAACAPESILAPETAPEPASAVLDVKPADASEGAALDEKSAAETAAAQVVMRCLDSIAASPGEPLYIVDGVPLGGPPDIQALDIHEIQVLKSTAAASLYGTRASSGVVVIITTRADHARRRA